MGRYDKEKGRWVSFNEDVEEAAEIGRKLTELGGVHNSDVAAEQADWDADEVEEPSQPSQSLDISDRWYPRD